MVSSRDLDLYNPELASGINGFRACLVSVVRLKKREEVLYNTPHPKSDYGHRLVMWESQPQKRNRLKTHTSHHKFLTIADLFNYPI